MLPNDNLYQRHGGQPGTMVPVTFGGGRRILVVEDDPMTRGLLADVLEGAGFVVVSVSNAADARRAAAAADPDGLVLDVDLGPGANGFDVADALLVAYPYLGVLFLTHLPDSRFAGRELESLPPGAGYVRKERLSEPGVLVAAVDSALRGAAVKQPRDDRDPDRPLGTLTATQIEVLRMIAQGLTNQQIADARATSVQAVVQTITRAMQAIGAPESSEGNARVVAARRYMRAAGIPSTDDGQTGSS